MPPVGFEPAISAGERTQTYALDGAAGHWDRQLHQVISIKYKYLHYEPLRPFKLSISNYLWHFPLVTKKS
jgi:hypothetical protein